MTAIDLIRYLETLPEDTQVEGQLIRWKPVYGTYEPIHVGYDTHTGHDLAVGTL